MRNFIIGIFAIMLSGCGGGFKAADLASSDANRVTSTLCTPNALQSCQAGNRTGSQTCNSSGSAWGACGNFTSCNSGFNLQNGACVANACTPNTQQSCQTGNGTGSQSCNGSGSKWGVCGNLTSCNSGFNLQSGACVANVCNPNAQQSCKAGGGTGSQSCNSSGSAWGACGNITSCSPGYSIINGICLVNFCTPNAHQSCQTGNGTGSQTCGMGAWGSCGNLTSCNSGYNLQNGVCVVNVCIANSQRFCQTGNGTGVQACNSAGSSWGICGNISSCNSGYSLFLGACFVNQLVCPVPNGSGTQTWANGAYGACQITGCNSGFNLQNGSCVVNVANVCTPNAQQSCQAGNGTGSQTCNSTGSTWGACGNLTSCNSGFNLQNGACVANACIPNAQQSCQAGNGTGSQACNSSGSAWGACGNITSCNSGYVLYNNSCLLASPTNAFLGQYYTNMTLSGSPAIVRNDSNVIFRWGYGDPGTNNSPDPSIPTTQWSAQWQGNWSFINSGSYRFYATTDDGIKVWVDGNLIINEWFDQTETTYGASVDLGQGMHQIVVQYYNDSGPGTAILSWAQSPSSLLATEKAQGCLAAALLSSALPNSNDFQALIARSNCSYLSRSIETWFGPPNFISVQSSMSALQALAPGKKFIYSLNIAEALFPGTYPSYHDPLTDNDLSMAAMCQAGNAWGPGTCVPSYFSPVYQQYVSSITQQALKLGVQDFVFGEMDLPDSQTLSLDSTGALNGGWRASDNTWETAPIFPLLFAQLRAAAFAKGIPITIGCQIGAPGYNWSQFSELQLCDYKYSPLLAENVDASTWTPAQWDDPASANWSNADWNNPSITSQTSVLVDFEWWSAVNDDMTLFSMQQKGDRAQFAFQAFQMLRNSGQGLMLPFIEPLGTTTNVQCNGIPQNGNGPWYSPSNTYCGDEGIFNDMLVYNTWSATNGGWTLNAGQCVAIGSLRLCMQTDGDLVLYQGNNVLWWTGNFPNYDVPPFSGGTANMDCGSCYATFQADGNLVLYDPNFNGNPYHAYWATGTGGDTNAFLTVTPNAPYLQLTLPNGTLIWN